MRKLIYVLVAFLFVFLSAPVFADDPALKFPMREGSNASAHKHNEEGISHYNQGHYDLRSQKKCPWEQCNSGLWDSQCSCTYEERRLLKANCLM